MSAKRKPKLGKCCKPMELVLSRPAANGLGLTIGSKFTFSTGEFSGALAYYFRKAKNGEPFQEIKGTFAWVLFCPFCGTPTEGQR